MRGGLIGKVEWVWAPRGVKIKQEVYYAYEGAYLNLLVNGLLGKLDWEWTKNMKSVSIAPVVKQCQGRDVKVIVWNRARGHRRQAYADIKAYLIEQPPYSPQLNPAEPVFECLSRKVEGIVYGNIAAKKAAVDATLGKLAADPDKMQPFAGWDWIC